MEFAEPFGSGFVPVIRGVRVNPLAIPREYICPGSSNRRDSSRPLVFERQETLKVDRPLVPDPEIEGAGIIRR